MIENSLDLLGFELDFSEFVYNLHRSSGSGFGEENSPLDLPASGLGRRNPKSNDGSVGSS